MNIYLVPLASFWCLWSAFGFPWRDFGVHLAPFGVHLAPFGVHLVPFGVHLVPFGVHLAPFGGHLVAFENPWGPPWAAKGHILGFCQKWASNSGPMALKSAACHQKLTSRNSITGSPGSPGSRQSATWPAARNPPSSRRGLG